MKKLLAVLALLLVASMVLVACQPDPVEPVDPTTDETTTEPTTDDPGANTTEPDTTPEPGTTDPGTTDPGTTEPGTTEPPETEPPVVVFEGNWHASVDSFMYCVNDDFSDVVAFTAASTNKTNGTTITNATGETLASVTANYVYFDNGWLAVDGYELENWAVSIYAEDGTLLKTIDLTLKEAEEGVVNHVSQNMGYGEGTVSHRVGNDVEVISLKEFHNQNVTVVYSVGVVGTEFTVDLIKLDVAVPLDPNAPVFFATAEEMSATIPGSPDVESAVMSADGTYITINTTDVDGNGYHDPYYQIPMLNGKGTVASVIAIKYRTSVEGARSEVFVGSGAGPAGGTDNYAFDVVADGKWHLMVIDLANTPAVVDGVINYLRWDPYVGGAATAATEMAYIGLFNSAEAAELWDDRYDDVYVDLYNVPQDNWTVTGHCTGIVGAEGHANSGMVAAGGVESGALLHQGYIALGEMDLSQFTKLIVYYGLDGSQVTIDLHAAAANNRILLTSADQSLTNSPTEDVILASATYTELGWGVKALVIDLTDVFYSGPVYVTYDTLPGTFMLISEATFVYGEKEAPAPEDPDPEDPAPESAVVDKATAGMINESCDTVTLNSGMYFEADGAAYDKLAAVDNKITIKSGDVLGFRGWIGFPQAFDQFGYIINDGEFVGGEYTQSTEEIIYTLAGENASRYHIIIDTTGTPAGDYTVTWGAKLADGTVVAFYTVVVTVEAAPEEPAPSVESLVVDLNTEANSAYYNAEWPAAGISTSFYKLGYNHFLACGTLDLSQYSKAEIVYSFDGTVGITDARVDAALSNAIGLKSEASAYGWYNNEPNFSGDLGHTDYVFSNGGWTAYRTAEIDLSAVDYNGEVWLSIYNPEGTEIVIHSLTLIP